MLPLIVAILIIVADQLTKEWVRSAFALEQMRPVIAGFFNLTYVRNTGAAWGMFGGQNTGLTLLSAVVLVLMIVFRRKFLGDTWDHRLALGLMIGGITGNLLDRFRLNFVTDFLDFHIGVHHFPSFNIADSAICCGVGLYMLSTFWTPNHAAKTDASARPEVKSA
jgi:signal peptidase II